MVERAGQERLAGDPGEEVGRDLERHHGEDDEQHEGGDVSDQHLLYDVKIQRDALLHTAEREEADAAEDHVEAAMSTLSLEQSESEIENNSENHDNESIVESN